MLSAVVASHAPNTSTFATEQARGNMLDCKMWTNIFHFLIKTSVKEQNTRRTFQIVEELMQIFMSRKLERFKVDIYFWCL